jgi:hypothetical protein
MINKVGCVGLWIQISVSNKPMFITSKWVTDSFRSNWFLYKPKVTDSFRRPKTKVASLIQ